MPASLHLCFVVGGLLLAPACVGQLRLPTVVMVVVIVVLLLLVVVMVVVTVVVGVVLLLGLLLADWRRWWSLGQPVAVGDKDNTTYCELV